MHKVLKTIISNPNRKSVTEQACVWNERPVKMVKNGEGWLEAVNAACEDCEEFNGCVTKDDLKETPLNSGVDS